MFRKLLKHEFRATGKVLGILSAAALSLSVLGGMALRLLLHMGETIHESYWTSDLAFIGLFLSLAFIILALAVYGAVVQLYQYWRFYRHKFTDEGYLTFTLPASPLAIYASAYVSVLLWTLVSFLVVGITVIGIALIGAGEYLFSPEALSAFAEITEDFQFLFEQTGSPGLMLFCYSLSILAAPAITMTCITVGAVVAKKHKILAAFGIYYGVSTLTGFIQTLLTMFSGLMFLPDPLLLYRVSLLIPSLISVLLALGGSWLSIWLMFRKLNLP